MQKIKVGLIGFGLGGRVFHAPFINYIEGFELSKIRVTNEERIKEAKAQYPDVEIVPAAEDIYNDPEIDLVAVVSPNKFHHHNVKEALLAGKHVVVDKPFTVTSGQADELIALAKQQNKVLSVLHNRRWDSDFKTLKKVLDSGKLGRIVEFENHFDRFRNTIRPNTWKEEGSLGTGLLYDLGSHLIDQAQVLFGLPRAVTAFTAIQRQGGDIIDNFELLMHYDGLKVTIKSGLLVKEPLPKYIVLGEQGSFVKYGLDVQEAAMDKGTMALSDSEWGKEPKDLWGTINYVENNEDHREVVESEPGSYVDFYQNIYDTIVGKAELIVTPQQARNTIRIIELAMQSNEEKRTIAYS